MAFQQPHLPNLTSATPSIPPIATFMPDDHHSQPSQPAVAGSHWSNPQLNDLLTECSNPQRFNGNEGAFGASLSPRPPKLAPMEPRIAYEGLPIAELYCEQQLPPLRMVFCSTGGGW
ncbi:hypothetical protein DM02DRAFT_663248 [Periconia macrospinosa]|uniref:Uncharacterized protein n=1 Tax=Periconia macrospinosa TaxID=97972 RepID=A0A2V1D4I1_9PLEO|nr:hypothetical protein DM02DRAFT_663248 [Periconia macrospinosa]